MIIDNCTNRKLRITCHDKWSELLPNQLPYLMPETFPSTYPSILPSKYIRCLCPSSLPPCKLANDELIDLTRLPIGEYGPWSKQSMKVYSCPGRCLLVRPPKWLLRTSILIILLGILFHIIKSSLIFSSKRSKIGLLFVFLMQKVQLLMLLHRCAEAERR